DVLRGGGAVRVAQVVAEEVFVVLVVPGVGLISRLVRLRFLGSRPRVRGLQLLRRLLFEERVLDHFLVEEIRELKRAHREQLDGLLQRWRQNQLLEELSVKFLLQHEAMRQLRRLNVDSCVWTSIPSSTLRYFLDERAELIPRGRGFAPPRGCGAEMNPRVFEERLHTQITRV